MLGWFGERIVWHWHEVWNPCTQSAIHVFEKLENEIQNFIVRFCFYLNIKNEIQIFDYHYHF